MAAYPLSNLGAHKIARQWLTSFSKASTSGDASTIATVPSFSEMPNTTLNSSCARRPIFFGWKHSTHTSWLPAASNNCLALRARWQCSVLTQTQFQFSELKYIRLCIVLHTSRSSAGTSWMPSNHLEARRLINWLIVEWVIRVSRHRSRAPRCSQNGMFTVRPEITGPASSVLRHGYVEHWTLNVDTVLSLEVRDRWIWYLARYCAKTKQRRQWIKIWQSKSALNLKYCSLNHRLFNGLVNVVNVSQPLQHSESNASLFSVSSTIITSWHRLHDYWGRSGHHCDMDWRFPLR